MNVTIDTSRFYAVMNRKPSGFGTWIFRIGNEMIWFEMMSYREAVKKARRKALSLSVPHIALMP